jgi:hypothetical protein
MIGCGLKHTFETSVLNTASSLESIIGEAGLKLFPVHDFFVKWTERNGADDWAGPIPIGKFKGRRYSVRGETVEEETWRRRRATLKRTTKEPDWIAALTIA